MTTESHKEPAALLSTDTSLAESAQFSDGSSSRHEASGDAHEEDAAFRSLGIRFRVLYTATVRAVLACVAAAGVADRAEWKAQEDARTVAACAADADNWLLGERERILATEAADEARAASNASNVRAAASLAAFNASSAALDAAAARAHAAACAGNDTLPVTPPSTSRVTPPMTPAVSPPVPVHGALEADDDADLWEWNEPGGVQDAVDVLSFGLPGARGRPMGVAVRHAAAAVTAAAAVLAAAVDAAFVRAHEGSDAYFAARHDEARIEQRPAPSTGARHATVARLRPLLSASPADFAGVTRRGFVQRRIDALHHARALGPYMALCALEDILLGGGVQTPQGLPPAIAAHVWQRMWGRTDFFECVLANKSVPRWLRASVPQVLFVELLEHVVRPLGSSAMCAAARQAVLSPPERSGRGGGDDGCEGHLARLTQLCSLPGLALSMDVLVEFVHAEHGRWLRAVQAAGQTVAQASALGAPVPGYDCRRLRAVLTLPSVDVLELLSTQRLAPVPANDCIAMALYTDCASDLARGMCARVLDVSRTLTGMAAAFGASRWWLCAGSPGASALASHPRLQEVRWGEEMSARLSALSISDDAVASRTLRQCWPQFAAAVLQLTAALVKAQGVAAVERVKAARRTRLDELKRARESEHRACGAEEVVHVSDDDSEGDGDLSGGDDADDAGSRGRKRVRFAPAVVIETAPLAVTPAPAGAPAGTPVCS